jgi:tetratricopeptide (TPR) repeat protein
LLHDRVNASRVIGWRSLFNFVVAGSTVSFGLDRFPVYVLSVPSFLPKDRMLLEAAAGWLMLNNSAEALREFDQISPAGKNSPEALATLWEIYAHMRHWDKAVQTADRLIEKIDHQPDGYIKRAYALHELKRSQEAWDTLHPISNQFSENWLIPYNLACYAAQLGKTSEALKWFRRAMRIGNERELREMALSDPDLQPIRPKIENLQV